MKHLREEESVLCEVDMQKKSLKGKKADRPYNSDLTLFTLNLKTIENQTDFAART